METRELEPIQQRLRELYDLQDALFHDLIRFFEELAQEDREEEGGAEEEAIELSESWELLPYYADSELAPIAPLEGAELYLCRTSGQLPVRLLRLREEIERLDVCGPSGDDDPDGAQAFNRWLELQGKEGALAEEFRIAGLTVN